MDSIQIRILAWLTFLAVVFPVGLIAGEQPKSADKSAAAITEISLERNCFGCPTGSLLVLRRDGTATYTVTGSARQGTTDQVSQGKVSPKDFDRLTKMILASGFFDLAEEYGDPEQRDGKWAAISVTRGNQSKKVISREDSGPQPLQDLIKEIDQIGVDLFSAHSKQ